MTSLERQLKRLAVPHTQAVLSRDVKRASFLFDPKEAANLDKETIFALGLSGIEELENIDEAFVIFEKPLFDQSTKNWERSLQTKEVNAQLDETIGKFLIHLSPYFLLKSAHKALEWLIYRFHVHHFNKDDLLLCVLPYHETKVFVRLLQLLKLSSPTDKWHWLDASAKTGVPVPRTSIINHCKADLGFLSFICDIAPKFVKIHGPGGRGSRAALSLVACCLLGVAQLRENITDRAMAIIMPHLINGFKSKCGDYKAMAYMVLSQLVTQTQLKPTTITSILPVLTRKMHKSHSSEALVCLALVFRTHTVALDKKSFKYLCRVPGLVSLLSIMAQKYDMTAFLKCWLDCLVPAASLVDHSESGFSSDSSDVQSQAIPNYGALLLSVVSEVTMDSKLAQVIIGNVLKVLLERRQNLIDHSEEWSGWQHYAQELVGALERRYSKGFDAAVEQLLADENTRKNLKHLQELLSLSRSPMKHQIVPDAGTSLILGLSHASASQRLLAVKHLTHCLTSGEKSGVDEMCCELLLQRLSEDNPLVVEAVLDMQQCLVDTVENTSLTDHLLKIVQKYKREKNWKGCVEKSFRILVSDEMLRSHPKLALRLLPHLVVTSNNHATSLLVVMSAPAVKRLPILGSVCKEWVKTVQELSDEKNKYAILGRLNCLLVKQVAQHLSTGSKKQYEHLVKGLMDHSMEDDCSLLLLLSVLCQLLTHMSSIRQLDILDICQDLLQLLQQLQNKISSTDPGNVHLEIGIKELMPEWTKALSTEGPIPASTMYHAMVKLIRAVQNQIPANDEPWIDLSSGYSLVVLGVMDMLLKLGCESNAVKIWRLLVTHLVQDTIPSPVFCQILCGIWVKGESRHMPAHLIVGSYYLAKCNWEKMSAEELTVMLTSPIPVLSSLLISLLSPYKTVRHAALSCLGSLKSICQTSIHHSLLKKVIKSKHEIRIDPMHICQTMAGVYQLSEPSNDISNEKAEMAIFRESLYQLLHDVAIKVTPSIMVERILALLALVPHQYVMEDLVNLGELLVNNSENQIISSEDIDIMQHILNRYDESSAHLMSSGTSAWKLLLDVIKSDQKTDEGEQSLQVMALTQATRDFFTNLTDLALQRELVSVLVDVGTTTKSTLVARQVQSVLKQFKMESSDIEHELSIKEEQVTTLRSQKKTRVKKAENVICFPRVMLVLEVLQMRKKVKDSHSMAAMLFNLLWRLQGEKHEETEYCKQLTLSCLHNLCSRWTHESKPQEGEKFNVEVLVHCIRGSPSPQTQQQALIVMATIAHLFPEYVLHNVMLIFAFMGSQLLQQDDSHSFHIITTTITTIIPALLEVHEKKKKKLEANKLVHDILRVFVDARHSVPRHRCCMLFRELLTTVGIQQHLPSMLALIMESGVRTKDVPNTQSASDALQFEPSTAMDREVEFIVTVSETFSTATKVSACTQMLRMVQQLIALPDHGTKKYIRSKAKVCNSKIPPLTIETLTPVQIKLLQYYCTKMVANHLGRTPFVREILQLQEKGEAKDLMEDFKSLLHEALLYMSLVAQQYGANSHTNMAKFWRALLHKVYDILEKVNYLLPNSMFLELVSSLMSHDMPNIRKKALELLITKLQNITVAQLDEQEVAALLCVVKRLLEMVKGRDLTANMDADMANVQQVELYSVKLLCKMLGSDHPKAFTPLFPVVVDLLLTPDATGRGLGSSLLCLAELCNSLGVHAIQHLPTFMPPLLTAIEKQPDHKRDELFLTCWLTTLQRLVSSLPHFLSPYLLNILKAVCNVSCLIKVDDPSKKTQAGLWLKTVRDQLATLIPPRVLLPAVCDSHAYLLKHNQLGLSSLMQMVQKHVESISSEDLAAHHNNLITFFCEALDLRNAKLEVAFSEMEKLEIGVMDALLAMVVRLSEASFRPMFYKLYDWACGEDTVVHRHRQLAFFGLCQNLSSRLRSLFNLFVGHAIKMACQLLQKNNTASATNTEVDFYGDDEMARQHSCQLVANILGCLHKCMLYDTEGFVTKETFDLMLQPLVSQLENFLVGEDKYNEHIEKLVTPCLAYLALACRDDSAWKALNYEVLLKTRHSSPKVRFAALATVDALAQKLGQEYMKLLPETIPFLAELMEDESEEVEHQCQAVIASMEEVLGESLQKYF